MVNFAIAASWVLLTVVIGTGFASLDKKAVGTGGPRKKIFALGNY